MEVAKLFLYFSDGGLVLQKVLCSINIVIVCLWIYAFVLQCIKLFGLLVMHGTNQLYQRKYRKQVAWNTPPLLFTSAARDNII